MGARRARGFALHALAGDAHLAAGDEGEGERIEPQLDGEHPLGECLRRVAIEHRHCGLGDDRTGIDLRHDEVHGGAVDLHAGFERALVGVETAEGGQEGRVDVEHAPGPSRHQPWGEEPHEAGEADELDPVVLQHRLDRTLERLAILAVKGVIDDRGRDPRITGPAERRRVRAV